jgi:uncharacterized SAM-binding protein YcdF (DUF218 family)
VERNELFSRDARPEIRRRARNVPRRAARSVAIAVGSFTLVNLVGEALRPGFDASIWWIDLRGFPAGVALPLLGVSAVLLLALGLRPRMRARRRVGTTLLLGLLIGVSAWNAVAFVVLLRRGVISSSFPVPFSAFVVVALIIVWVGLCRPGARGAEARGTEDGADASSIRVTRSLWRRALGAFAWALALGVCWIAFPLAQVFCFGKTDYRRPADAIVVFGCLAYADGTPSTSLADRVRTGCDLYHQHLADRIIFSGGPSAGGVQETEVMRDLALELGVPADAIVLDSRGVNTRATVINTSELFEKMDVHSVLAVSHFYHLPRIKLSYQRLGVVAYTVPAKESRWIRKTPRSVAREVLALWYYYLRPLAG